MPEKQPVDLQQTVKGMSDAELQQFNTWLITERYQVRAGKLDGLPLPPVGSELMPVDGAIIKSPMNEDSVIPSYTDPEQIDTRLALMGQFTGDGRILTVVGSDGRYWVGPDTDQSKEHLKDAGYKEIHFKPVITADHKFTDPDLQTWWSIHLHPNESLIPPDKKAEVEGVITVKDQQTETFNSSPEEERAFAEDYWLAWPHGPEARKNMEEMASLRIKEAVPTGFLTLAVHSGELTEKGKRFLAVYSEQARKMGYDIEPFEVNLRTGEAKARISKVRTDENSSLAAAEPRVPVATPQTVEEQVVRSEPKELVEEEWVELREALWQAKLESEESRETISQTSHEIAAAVKIAKILGQLDTPQVAEIIKTHPPRFQSIVMPTFERMFPEQSTTVHQALYNLWVNEFSQSVGNNTFEEAAKQLHDLRKQYYESRGYQEPTLEEKDQRLRELTSLLAPQIDLESADPENIIGVVPDSTTNKIFVEIQELGDKAPAKWREAMDKYVRTYNITAEQLDHNILYKRLKQLYCLLNTSSIPPFVGRGQKTSDELHQDIIERLMKPKSGDSRRWSSYNYPLGKDRQIIASLLNYASTHNLSTETKDTLKSIQDRMIILDREIGMEQEEEARINEASTPDEIIFFLRRNFLERPHSEISSEFQTRLSRALNLPEEDSFETALQERQRLMPYLILNSTLRHARNSGILENQITLLKEFYLPCSPEIREALEETTNYYSKAIAAYDKKEPADHLFSLFYQALSKFDSLRGQLMSQAHPEVFTDPVPDSYSQEKKFEELLKPSTNVSNEILIQAFIEKNRAQVKYLQYENKRHQIDNQFDQDLAQKTGISIKYWGDKQSATLKKL